MANRFERRRAAFLPTVPDGPDLDLAYERAKRYVALAQRMSQAMRIVYGAALVLLASLSGSVDAQVFKLTP